MPEIEKCPCGGEFIWSRHCGAKVCTDCDAHKGLARCFCGWAADGGNGRQQLEEMGETIEPEDGGFFGESFVFDEPGVEEFYDDSLRDSEADMDNSIEIVGYDNSEEYDGDFNEG